MPGELLAAPAQLPESCPALLSSKTVSALGSAFSDTSAAERKRRRGLLNRLCQVDKEQNAFKMERELCLGRTKLRKENRYNSEAALAKNLQWFCQVTVLEESKEMF